MSSATPDRTPRPTTPPPLHLPPLRKQPKPVAAPTTAPTPTATPVEQTLPSSPSAIRAATHTATLPDADVPTPPPLPPFALSPPPLPAPGQVVPPPLPGVAQLQPWSADSIGPAARSELEVPLDNLRIAPPPLPPVQTLAKDIASGPPTAPTLAENSRVGQYVIRELIGEGGMGLVYRAEDRRLKRPVALKVMKPEIASDERAWKLFLTEAQAMAALKDDRIATIYVVDEDKAGRCYMAMELLHGESLESRLKRGPVSLEQALWIVREAALGLKVAHNANFVHRDIKPANLWLETDASKPRVEAVQSFKSGEPGGRESQYLRVKIVDFGLARLERDEDGKRKNSVVGTPAYMSPEQAAGREANHSSDIFSLGVVLFRLLTGQLPFEGETSMEVLTALTTKTPPLVSQFNPNLPKPLVELVQKMLSRDPLARPSSAADVARLLEAIGTFVLAPPPPPRRPKRTFLITSGVIAAMLLACFGVWWFGIRSDDSDDVPLFGSATSNKVLDPAEAAIAIGDRVTVEFIVGAVRRTEGGAFLYEQPPPAKIEGTIFRALIPSHVIAEMRKKSGTMWPEALDGARVRFHGTVLREGKFAELLVAETDQIDKVEYKERPGGAKAMPGEKPAGAAGAKPKEPPPGLGADLPATDGPTPRGPNQQNPDELKDAVKKAARDILGPLMGKDKK